MTIEQIKEMVAGSQYDFLRTNPHLTGRIIFLTLGGSHAYGTNVETSDVDIRGCALNSRSDLLGLSTFEQVVNTETDTTIYSFNKLISLLINCNPNTIELLGCKPELHTADALAHTAGMQQPRVDKCVKIRKIVDDILASEQCFSLKHLDINGKDIISLGVPEGKVVGAILQELLCQVIDGQVVNEREALIQKAKEMVK